jgi:hypothetical protein
MQFEQKVIITDDAEKINQFLEQGWQVIMLSAQHISHAATYVEKGSFCFVLEKRTYRSSKPDPYLGPEV